MLAADGRSLFWILNLLGWSGYLATGFVGVVFYEKTPAYRNLIILVSTLGFLHTLILRPVLRYLWRKNPWWLSVGTLLSCFLVAAAWRFVSNLYYANWVDREWIVDNTVDLFSGTMSSFYVILSWTGLYFGIKYYRQLQMQTEKTLKANAAAHFAQLRMLRYQLNPHFLFNTLNAISTLILDQKGKQANLTVTKLGEFLRYTLDHDLTNLVTVRKELEALDLYLQIEKVRFGERLEVERNIEAASLDALVPSLILQPLIENAIKYAVTPREEGGSVRIDVRVLNNQLCIALSDDGPGIENNQSRKGKGVGLKNTRQRLLELYGEQQAFTLSQNKPTGLMVTINIPLQYRSND